MCRKPKHESLPAFSRLRCAGLALGLLLLLFGFVYEAEAQKATGKPPTSGQPEVQEPVGPSLSDYVPAEYSLEGPLTVYSATKEAITFFTGSEKKLLVLDLKGTSVSVKDAQNGSLSFNALTKGVRVYVSRSPDKKSVIIFVMPTIKKENNNV